MLRALQPGAAFLVRRGPPAVVCNIDSPNRYGLPAHYELHVWAWRDNPNGAFVDWNNRVTCEGQ